MRLNTMHAPETIEKLRALLAKAATIRAAAKEAGVGIGTAHRVKSGQRVPRGYTSRTTRPYRCLGCGNKVKFKPCVICAAKNGK